VKVALEEKADDSAAVATGEMTVADSLHDRFAMTSLVTAKHPSVVAYILDPARKSMSDFPDDIRTAAYDHVRSLVTSVESTVVNAEEEVQEPPTKRARDDVRSTTISFLARCVDVTQASLTAEFGRYLDAEVSAPDCDLPSWWKDHQDVYANCATVARHYHVIPASSAASECLFSATDMKRSRLLPECVESLMFLKRNN